MLSVLSSRENFSLIDGIDVLSAIHNRLQDFHAITIFVYLRTHVFSYNISRWLFDFSIRKLKIISQSIEEGIWVTWSRCITITIFSSTNKFRVLEKLPLRQIQFCMDPLIRDRFLKTESAIRNVRIIVFRQLNSIWVNVIRIGNMLSSFMQFWDGYRFANLL